MQRLEPRPDNACFGCGGANPRGLQLTFTLDHARRRVLGEFNFGPELQGSQGMLHGGVIALLLDEAMGKLSRFSDVRAVTAELQVEYLRPIPAGLAITVEAEEVSREGRNLHTRAEIRRRDGDPRPLARGRARFVALAPR
ncbi:MAG: PaaI family thioesterase [Terriglobales bacterium]